MNNRFCVLLVALTQIWITATGLAEPLVIGVSAPMQTGWGQDQRNVLEFANEKLAQGRYLFVVEDDNCGIKEALSVAQKLVTVDKVNATFVVCGQSTIASAPTYRRAGIPVLASLATPSQISQLGVIRTALSDAHAGELLLQVVAQRVKEIAVLTEENDYPVSFLRDFERHSGRLGVKVDNRNFLPDQRDFRSQLLLLKQRKIEALFLNTQTEESLHLLVRQLKEINYTPQLYGAYRPGSEHFLEIGGALAEGLVFVDFPVAQDMLTPEGKELYAEYLKRYGPMKGWSFAFPSTFEGFRVIDRALQTQKPIDQFIKHAYFDGIFGPYRFDENGDIVGPKHVLRIIKNGKSVPYRPPEAKEKSSL